jgi:ABC-2 type transport system ATP-binding protein
LLYLATLKGLDEKTARKRLPAWLERMELYDHRQKKVQELSKGMQQKAQLIATFLHDPDLIVIDEPFSGLDPVNTRLVKEIIEEQRLAGKAILMSTHQMYQVEALCNRIILINEGHTVLYGAVMISSTASLAMPFASLVKEISPTFLVCWKRATRMVHGSLPYNPGLIRNQSCWL